VQLLICRKGRWPCLVIRDEHAAAAAAAASHLKQAPKNRSSMFDI